MEKSYFKKLSICLSICFVLLCTVLIINSCKKDNTVKTQTALTNPAVLQAKTWYESTYPVNTGSKLTTQSVNTTNSGVFDYSQYVKPYWSHAATYSRLNKNVVEIPIDPSVKLGSAFKNQTANQEIYPKENSRSSFLLLSNNKNYDAYIMTIYADPSYLKNDTSKLSHNTYLKHDADFTGLVLYFTPKGQYVSGFAYKNGKLIIPASAVAPSSGQTVQSVKTPNLKTNVEQEYDCTFYYNLT
jgi:hypothetical protein